MPIIQLPLFQAVSPGPPARVRDNPFLAGEYGALSAALTRAIERFGSVEAVVHHLALAMIEHLARTGRRRSEWPQGLRFSLPRMGSLVFLGPDLLPVGAILDSMRRGVAAPIVMRAASLSSGADDALGWLEYAARGGRTALCAQPALADVAPIFDDLWLRALDRRDGHIRDLVALQMERLDAASYPARGGMKTVSRDQLKRRIARCDAHLIVLETLLPPGVTAEHYERYLRLRTGRPEPRFGSYGHAAGVLL